MKSKMGNLLLLSALVLFLGLSILLAYGAATARATAPCQNNMPLYQWCTNTLRSPCQNIGDKNTCNASTSWWRWWGPVTCSGANTLKDHECAPDEDDVCQEFYNCVWSANTTPPCQPSNLANGQTTTIGWYFLRECD